MTFLTQLHLNPQRRQAKRVLGSPRAMHACVEGGFPPSEEAVRHRNLWRLDEAVDRVTLYLVSDAVPDLTALVEQAGWPSAERGRTADYRLFVPEVGVDGHAGCV